MTKILDDDHRVQAVNTVASEVLKNLLDDYVHMTEADEDERTQYEINFVGDLYARMVVSFIMGYNPDVMGGEAVESAVRLHKLVIKEGEEDEGNT